MEEKKYLSFIIFVAFIYCITLRDMIFLTKLVFLVGQLDMKYQLIFVFIYGMSVKLNKIKLYSAQF